MANNKYVYGFRPYRALTVSPPAVYERQVATGFDMADDASNDVALRAGDPLKAVAGGTVSLALTTDKPEWIMFGCSYYDTTNRVRVPFSKSLPHAAAWTTEQTKPIIHCYRAKDFLWAICVDDAVTATTAAGYRALVGFNAPHVVPGDTTNGWAKPLLDISAATTTAGLEWRIVEIATIMGMDLTGTNVSVIVQVNDSTEAGSPATNVTAV